MSEEGTAGGYSRAQDAEDDVRAGDLVLWSEALRVLAFLVCFVTAVSDVIRVEREGDGAGDNGVGFVPVTNEVPVDGNIATTRETILNKRLLESSAVLIKGKVGVVAADASGDDRCGFMSAGVTRRGRKWSRRVADIRTLASVVCRG